MSASWGWSPMFKQCSKVHRATAVTSTHPCRGLIPGDNSSEASRAGREERTPALCRDGHHTISPQVLCRDTLVPEQPDTYVNLTEDDVNDAADHYEEVEDIPGIPEVTLPGKSRRRGVTIQGLNHGRDRRWSPEEGVSEGSDLWHLRESQKKGWWSDLVPLVNCLGLSCNGVKGAG